MVIIDIELRVLSGIAKLRMLLSTVPEIFFSDFNETGIFLTNLNKGPQYNIKQKFDHWETSCSMRTDGLDEGNNYVSYLCGRAEQYKIELIVALPWKQFFIRLSFCCRSYSSKLA
jgi:hypothetical protein